MMKSRTGCYRLLAAASLLAPSVALATNGYFLIGFGAKSRGMGGVGVAYAQDGLAAAFNPAGMADAGVDTMRIDIGAELFNPPRAVRQDSAALESGFPGSDGGVNHRSGSNLFLIPNMGMIYKFNRKMYIGMAAIGAGLGTRYHQDVPGKPGCLQGTTTANGNANKGVGSSLFNFNCNADSYNTGVSLMQMQMLPSIAYKVNNTQTVGASLALAVQTFRAFGLGAFQDLGFAPSKEDVSGRGNDWSYGAGVRFGWTGKFLDERLTLGANYASRVYMTRFDKYKNLFAEQGSFDIPEHFAFGTAVKLTDKLTIAADAQHILYSDIRSVSNTGPSAADPGDLNTNGSCAGVADDIDPGNCKLGGNDGMGFGWQDQWVYKVGLNYDFNTRWSFRAGYNYGKSPIPEDQVLFNMLAPATVEQHATIGASYRPSRNIEWSFNGMHAFENTVKGPSAFGPTGDPNIDKNVKSTALTMKQWSLGVSFAYKL
jgi:long-chain fatty acid transport protein